MRCKVNQILNASCVVAGVCIMHTTATANLIQNGSFELGVDPPTDMPGVRQLFVVVPEGTSRITGWEVIGMKASNDPRLDVAGVDWVHRSLFEASDGEFSLDLNGTPGKGGVRQTFDTIPGTRYDVSFDMAFNPFGARDALVDPSDPFAPIFVENLTMLVGVSTPGDSQFFDQANFQFDRTESGIVIPPFEPDANGNFFWNAFWDSNGGRRQWSFIAEDTMTTLTFLSTTDPFAPDDPRNAGIGNVRDYGPALDNVVVNAVVPPDNTVPEPLTVTLGVMSLAAVNLATRRR